MTTNRYTVRGRDDFKVFIEFNADTKPPAVELFVNLIGAGLGTEVIEELRDETSGMTTWQPKRPTHYIQYVPVLPH